MLEAHKNDVSEALFKSALSYLIYARESRDLQPLFNQLIKQIPEYEEDVMTYAEELRQEGIQQGMQQGRQEGMHEATHKIVQEMLKAGAELSFIKKVSHLSKREIEEIQKSMH
jgi:predicted transposase/invertase (TIGR01784 family)